MGHETILKYYGNSSPIITVENVYDNNELHLIWRELEFLTTKEKMMPAEIVGTAVYADGSSKKKSVGIFLDAVYANRRISDILTINRKILNFDFVNSFCEKNKLFEGIRYTNHDSCMISYYENEGKYDCHKDGAYFTILTYFLKEPKQFSGGDLIFNDFDLKIEVKNNMAVIFHSCFNHEVTEVKMNIEDSDGFSGLGRYCMSQFLGLSLYTPK